MAVVAHTTYTTSDACSRSNTYIADGHGCAQVDRTNRYICNGHGGGTQCLGHNCPSDPALATAYMDTIRWNYERQHSTSADRKKKTVTHVQLYVSPTECDHVPTDERLEMTKELIDRTVLKEFPSIFIAHDNTEIGHCHISLCPFSPDGSHKLCVNNKLLYDLRREMDYICYEHGYSIIDAPELRNDPGYRNWFQIVRDEGKITIHPPRRKDKHLDCKPHKRARNYDHSKRKKVKKRADKEKYIKNLTDVYSFQKDEYFYTSNYLYHPKHPDHPIRLKRLMPDGKECSEMELTSAALGVWAGECAKELNTKYTVEAEALAKRMRTISKNAFTTLQIIKELDIRNLEGLVMQIKEVGQDIGTLKRNIQRHQDVLQSLGGASSSDSRVKYAQNRIDNSKKLLEDRSREYRNLKRAEAILDPANHRTEWHSYLDMMTDSRLSDTAMYTTRDDIDDAIYELEEQFDYIISKDGAHEMWVEEILEWAGLIDYDEPDQPFYIRRSDEERRRDFRRCFDQLEEIRELRGLSDHLAGFGVLGFLLSLLVEIIADMRHTVTRIELASLQWESLREMYYKSQERPSNRTHSPYHPEWINEYRNAASKAHNRAMEAISRIETNSMKPEKHYKSLKDKICQDVR